MIFTGLKLELTHCNQCPKLFKLEVSSGSLMKHMKRLTEGKVICSIIQCLSFDVGASKLSIVS